MRHLITWVALLAVAGMAFAAAPEAPCPPSTHASGPVATAPSNSTERLAANSRVVGEDRFDATAVPQIAVPVQKGAPDAKALKPGKQQLKPSGEIDDAAARCQAARP